MNKYDKAMDDILVQGKIINEITNKQTSDSSTNTAVSILIYFILELPQVD